MLIVGCHLSATKGFMDLGRQAEMVGANTFQFFTRNPRGGAAKPIDPKDVSHFLKFAAEKGISHLLAHAPYTLNACSADSKVREFAHMIMADDLHRMEYIPNSLYNFHPGSHVGQGIEKGIEIISDLLNEIISPDQTTTVLLETMSGKGSEVGSKFEELAEIIAHVKYQDKMGVCLDTCHVHDAGYDIVNNLDGVLNEFDKIVGLDRLRAIHLNDSKNPFESHKDRHEKLGEGFLGAEVFKRIINHPKLRHLPFYLETPNELDGYAEEIAWLKSNYQG